MIIIMLHYNCSTIMQCFYMAMAIKGPVYIINVVCCSQVTTMNFNKIVVIINLQSMTMDL